MSARFERGLAAALTKLDEQFASDAWLYQTGGLRQVGVKIHVELRGLKSAGQATGSITLALTPRRIMEQLDTLNVIETHGVDGSYFF